ncbi:MAG: hypothetical protein AAGB05_03460 [Pseudomonadota bacterium]
MGLLHILPKIGRLALRDGRCWTQFQRRRPGLSSALRWPGFALAILMLGAWPAAAEEEQDLFLIVDRTDRAVEIFFSAGAETLSPLLGPAADGLAARDGAVDVGSFQNGTFDLGDALFADVATALNGTPLVFEAMSVMFHPEDLGLPFATPLDGLMSIEVCSALPSDTPVRLETLTAYAGYIAYTDAPGGALSLHLPETGREALRVSLTQFRNGRFVGTYEREVADGGVLDVPGPSPVQGAFLSKTLVALAALLNVIALGCATVIDRRARPSLA